MALPDFFLIGAPKAGTTALHVALARHRDLFLSTIKEPKFFLTDGPPPRGGGPGDDRTYRAYVWRRPDYEALFATAPPGVLKGESTTLYLADPAAHRRIRDMIPDAKLIAVVREPVDRAHSNWMHLRSAGLEAEADFVRACELGEQRVAAGWGPFWNYPQQSMYGANLQKLYEVFPREQVLVLLYRHLRADPVGTLDRACEFLGVPAGLVDEVPAENVTAAVDPSWRHAALGAGVRALTPLINRLPARWHGPVERAAHRTLQREQRTRTPVTAEQRAALAPRFAEDITLLEQLTGLDLEHWRDPHAAPPRPPLSNVGRVGTGHGSIDQPIKPA